MRPRRVAATRPHPCALEHRIIVWMVLAWLASSRADHRYTEKGALPFLGDGQTHRRRQRLGVATSRVETPGGLGDAVARKCLGNDPAESVEAPVPLPDGCIFALASLAPSFQYDDTKSLEASDRALYDHWVRSGVDPSVLWFFTLATVAPLSQPTPARVYGPRTTEALLCDLSIEPVEKEWPPFHVSGSMLRLCVMLPTAFADAVRRAPADFPRIAVPSPFSPGVFRTPRWLQALLHKDIAGPFAATQDQCGVGPRPIPFAMTDAHKLADDLRSVCVCVCQQAGCHEVLVPWIRRLQALSDSLVPGTPARHVSTDMLVKLMLHAENLKRQAML